MGSAATVKHTVKHKRHKVDIFSGNFTIGSSGAISAQSIDASSGATVVKTSSKTGRYTVTLDETGLSILPHQPTIEGAADTAIGNTAGNVCFVRNVGKNSFDIQVMLASSGADTETASGNKIHWSCELRRQSP